ncbi:putative RNA methyltransferase [Streptomyces sp. NPDC091290]|uniref:putative RNA methyltransferase n=1 Tax=Streptomyces sp. NPDC091290 TaxID=3365990 RepID=UPI003829C6D8
MSKLLPSSLVPFVDLLRCPMCCGHLHPAPGALRCAAGHTFNIARQGYVSLLSGTRATSADDAEMARSRERFLSTGGYAPIREAVARLTSGSLPEQGTVVDVGCGTGYYLVGVLDQQPGASGLGLDTSVRALRVAARAHERAAAASWDVFRPLPLADRMADAVLNVFAPRNPSEFHRVLRPAGRLIVVRPTSAHLGELRSHLPAMITIDPTKEQRLHRALGPYFAAVESWKIEYPLTLASQDVRNLVEMTPNARHLKPADLTDDDLLPEQVTISVLATVYEPR